MKAQNRSRKVRQTLSSLPNVPHVEASSTPAKGDRNTASLRKAFITLLGGRGKLPRPEELDGYAGDKHHVKSCLTNSEAQVAYFISQKGPK